MTKPTPSYTSDDDNDDASASWGSFRFSPLPSPSLPPPLKALVISALYSAAPPRLNTASLSVLQHNYDRPFGEHVDDIADSRADSEGSEDNFGWDGGKCGGEQGHTFTRDELRRYVEVRSVAYNINIIIITTLVLINNIIATLIATLIAIEYAH